MDCPFKNPGKWKESDLTLDDGENKRRDEGRCLVTRRDWWQEWRKLRKGKKKKSLQEDLVAPQMMSPTTTPATASSTSRMQIFFRERCCKEKEAQTGRWRKPVERRNVNPHQKTVMSSRWHTEWLMVNQIGLFFLGATRPFLSLDLFTKTNSAAQRSPCVAAEGVTGGDKFTGKWYSHFRTFLPQPLTRPTLMLCSTCLAKY